MTKTVAFALKSSQNFANLLNSNNISRALPENNNLCKSENLLEGKSPGVLFHRITSQYS